MYPFSGFLCGNTAPKGTASFTCVRLKGSGVGSIKEGLDLHTKAITCNKMEVRSFVGSFGVFFR